MSEDNGVETIEYENSLWLNETNLGKKSGYSDIRHTSTKYKEKYIRKRNEICKNCKKQPNRKFIREDLAVYLLLYVIKIPSVVKFRFKLGFKSNELILSKEYSIFIKIFNVFSPITKVIRQCNVLNYYVDLYLPEYNLAIEIDELGHKDRNHEKEMIRQEKMENDLRCKFIRTNPDRGNYDITVEIGKINKHIAEVKDEEINLLKNSFKKLNLETAL